MKESELLLFKRTKGSVAVSPPAPPKIVLPETLKSLFDVSQVKLELPAITPLLLNNISLLLPGEPIVPEILVA